MPVIKSAKKKLKQDKKRTLARSKTEVVLKDAVKKAIATPNEKNISKASSLLDKAAKKHIIHKNKAARVKSRLARLLSPKSAKTEAPTAKKATPAVKAKKAAKKTVKKTQTKKK